jgi:AcrR family transcriptional regulator
MVGVILGLREVQMGAVSLFASKGYAATGIRDLGQAVRLNSATLYHYTGGKEELLAGIMRGCLEELLRAGREAIATTAQPEIQLGRLVSTHVGLSAMNPLTARVTDHEIRALTPHKHEELIALRDDYESMFGQVLERGARSGVFRLTDLKVARLAILEMCNGVANWYQPTGELSVAQIQQRFVEYAGRLVGIDGLERRVDVHEYPPLLLPTEPPHPRSETSVKKSS